MSLINKTKTQSKSHVMMLPIIDLHATDMTALYSLLLFIEKQCKTLKEIPCVTFDQQLYVKAYEIVEAKKMNAFVRLGGFHQLMSFLGSIGTLMEGSGLRKALESVYTPVTVGHMFTGKAYSRAVRGHMLASSSLVSLLLDEFWNSLSDQDQTLLQTIYDAENPSQYEEYDIALALDSFIKNKVDTLSKESRTAALWINYIKYVSIVQLFIDAERRSDWISHVTASKLMLNLFAATGHNNYAKSCRLYIQSISELMKSYPEMHQQFMLGQHTLRRTTSGWSGLWTDLSIEQILMKSLKGRSGIIGRGISENVMFVWTKSMHR